MAIQQHPIPQNVTSFQFRLVGDMTLKQFFELAGGIVIGLIIYATGLPFFFKWPLVGLSVGLGAGMAFLPVAGRPMEQWLLAFFRSIYQPTVFTWNRTETVSTPSPVKVSNVVTKTGAVAESASASFAATQPASAVPAAPKPIATTTTATPPEKSQERVAVNLPIAPLHIDPQPKKIIQLESEKTPTTTISAVPAQMSVAQGVVRTSTPVFSSSLPIPSTPQSPNIVVGMTLTPEGKILDGAIVEIRLQGATVRATKSNKLGQFMFLKPLDNGVYQLTGEKDGFTFPTFSLTAASSVILPIKLQATSAVAIPAPVVMPPRPAYPPISAPTQTRPAVTA